MAGCRSEAVGPAPLFPLDLLLFQIELVILVAAPVGVLQLCIDLIDALAQPQQGRDHLFFQQRDLLFPVGMAKANP